MKKIVILGSSGSIGTQSLDIISKMKDISIAGLCVNSNVELLKQQIKRFKPKAVCVGKYTDFQNLKKWADENNIKVEINFGNEGLVKLATMQEADMVLVAMVGAAGLTPIIEAIKAKKDIAIANKEALVMAGSQIMSLAKENNVAILPVDSEHSAIFQCRFSGKKSEIKKILLTASGGPFYNYEGDFSKITVNQALNHPTWKMGKKITIDSATLMNKGLEAIEASVLFDVPMDKIEIVIHPQSIVHSMVEFVDGSIIAQMSKPDMRLPIQYALTYPNRQNANIEPLNLFQSKKLEFFEPDFKKFPCLSLAYKAANIGFTMPAVMNAANEIAVEAFLKEKIKFTDICNVVEKTMNAYKVKNTVTLDCILEADKQARLYATEIINERR